MTLIMNKVKIAMNLINTKIQKHDKIITYCFILFLCILMGANTSNPDYDAYKTYFDLKTTIPDIGFMLIIYIFRFLRLNYAFFRLVLTVISMLLIHQTVKKFLTNYFYVYFLYFIFPFFIDAVQIRNFFAMAIITYAIPFLIADNRRDNIKYVLFVILASTIHLSAIVYIIFVLTNVIKKNKKIRNILFIIIIIEMLVTVNRPLFIIVVNQIVGVLGLFDERIYYYSEVLTRKGYLFYWVIQLAFTYITKKLSDNMIALYNGEILNEKYHNIIKDFSIIVLNINFISLILLPTYAMQALYFRFFRNMMLINYTAILSTLQHFTSNRYKRYVIIFILVSMTSALFYIDIYRPFYESVILSIIKNNWFIPF